MSTSARYGLQAGVFTRDAKLIFSAYEALEVGGVIAGDVPTFRIDHMTKDEGRMMKDEPDELSSFIILPSSFTGLGADRMCSPRSARK